MFWQVINLLAVQLNPFVDLERPFILGLFLMHDPSLLNSSSECSRYSTCSLHLACGNLNVFLLCMSSGNCLVPWVLLFGFTEFYPAHSAVLYSNKDTRRSLFRFLELFTYSSLLSDSLLFQVQLLESPCAQLVFFLLSEMVCKLQW